MQILTLFVALATVVSGVNANSPSFGGANNYFIHATASSEQNDWVNTLSSWGAKVVRLWGELPLVPCLCLCFVAHFLFLS